MPRPLRTYHFLFVKASTSISLDAHGHTACQARRQAYDILETLLKQRPVEERQDWKLKSQTPSALVQ